MKPDNHSKKNPLKNCWPHNNVETVYGTNGCFKESVLYSSFGTIQEWEAVAQPKLFLRPSILPHHSKSQIKFGQRVSESEIFL